MPFTHACFISFSSDAGPATKFATLFYEELKSQLSYLDKTLSIFKYDQSGHVRDNDDWQLWILPQLHQSALMITIASPTYFKSAETCLKEFRCMQALARHRSQLLQNNPAENEWIIGIRICAEHEMPELNQNYAIWDFPGCRPSPSAVRQQRHRRTVEIISDLIFQRCKNMQARVAQLQVPKEQLEQAIEPIMIDLDTPDAFPSWTGVKP
ncbi:MAG: hypothetical protein KKE30_00950 [Gammaproteobacteria bacterium]|nr:hypothetical protein [Gammaproteobacteria bacterium]MBU1556334.1 hypothetical protein [Gammaproteobacteria bacterium]MBU2071524.1 hypothetical protein [Gammaproteobacteria bacterium]MBU2184015.1 hypothetical protein [Gammaproteobacteria bacterium]MBU2206899.1 hypothetical protein [Gammaproteobacteria bacterium]